MPKTVASQLLSGLDPNVALSVLLGGANALVNAASPATGIAKVGEVFKAAAGISPCLTAAGLATVDGAMARDVAKGLLSDGDRKAAMDRIATTTSFEDLVDCDLVMEAASENEEVKRKIFTRLSPYLKPGALIATNTSSISITRLASVTDRPENFIGLHFMNPVPLMQLVEVIRGIATNDSTFQAALEVVKRVGKTASYAEDFPAFIVNRILLPMINEGAKILEEGIAQRPGDIDVIWVYGYGWPAWRGGPMFHADQVGLKTIRDWLSEQARRSGDASLTPAPVLDRLAREGRGFASPS